MLHGSLPFQSNSVGSFSHLSLPPASIIVFLSLALTSSTAFLPLLKIPCDYTGPGSGRPKILPPVEETQDSVLGSGGFPGEGGYHSYSSLENYMDRSHVGYSPWDHKKSEVTSKQHFASRFLLQMK